MIQGKILSPKNPTDNRKEKFLQVIADSKGRRQVGERSEPKKHGFHSMIQGKIRSPRSPTTIAGKIFRVLTADRTIAEKLGAKNTIL